MNPIIPCTIREAEASDRPFMTLMLLEAAKASLNAISIEELPNHPDTEMYIKSWPEAGEIGVIAESGGESIGSAWLRIFPNPVHLANCVSPELTISVSPKHRRKGIAPLLLNSLYEAASRAGIKEIILGVHSENSPALALYIKHNWHTVGEVNDGEYIIMMRNI